MLNIIIMAKKAIIASDTESKSSKFTSKRFILITYISWKFIQIIDKASVKFAVGFLLVDLIVRSICIEKCF